MQKFEYKVVPAPERARKQRGLKGASLFAHSIESVMNELAAEGWRYVRADTLPQEERSGLTNKTTTYRNLLVFQREIVDTSADTAPAVAPPASPPAPPPAPEVEDDDITNLWHTPEDEAPSALVADRERKGVDL